VSVHSVARRCDTAAMQLADELTIDDAVLRGFCRRHGIRSLRLFGSAARNELRDDSDVDLLGEFASERTPGLLGMAKLELMLQELLGREVDLRTVGDGSPTSATTSSPPPACCLTPPDDEVRLRQRPEAVEKALHYTHGRSRSRGRRDPEVGGHPARRDRREAAKQVSEPTHRLRIRLRPGRRRRACTTG
jgi:uncharacterized protein